MSGEWNDHSRRSSHQRTVFIRAVANFRSTYAPRASLPSSFPRYIGLCGETSGHVNRQDPVPCSGAEAGAGTGLIILLPWDECRQAQGREHGRGRAKDEGGRGEDVPCPAQGGQGVLKRRRGRAVGHTVASCLG